MGSGLLRHAAFQQVNRALGVVMMQITRSTGRCLAAIFGCIIALRGVS